MDEDVKPFPDMLLAAAPSRLKVVRTGSLIDIPPDKKRLTWSVVWLHSDETMSVVLMTNSSIAADAYVQGASWGFNKVEKWIKSGTIEVKDV